jgi:hypothetical protein
MQTNVPVQGRVLEVPYGGRQQQRGDRKQEAK